MYKIFIVLFIFVLNNCSSINTEPKYAIESFDQNAPKILLMPIDIEICEITLAGMCEPNAIWTENSKKNIIVGFEEILKERNAIMNKFTDQIFHFSSFVLFIRSLTFSLQNPCLPRSIIS